MSDEHQFYCNCINQNFFNRGAGKVWRPDKEYYDQFKFPVLYPNELLADWKLPPFNGEL